MIYNPAVAFYAATRGFRNLRKNKKRKHHFDVDDYEIIETRKPEKKNSGEDNLGSIFFDVTDLQNWQKQIK